MTEQVLSLLGLAKKAGRVEVGEEPVGAAARAKKARVILVAQDAGPSSQRRAFSFAQTGACLCLTLPADKDALGRSLGRSSVAMCAVTDIGFAGAIAQKRKPHGPKAEQGNPFPLKIAVSHGNSPFFSRYSTNFSIAGESGGSRTCPSRRKI